MSRGGRTLGYYKLKKDANGEEIMEWHERILEGKWAIIAKTIMSYAGVRLKVENETNSFHKWVNKNFSNLENYRWNQLTSEDKAVFIDGLLTLAMWFSMYLGYLWLFADADDDDQYRKYTERIMTDFSQQYNMLEIGRLLADVRPPSVKVAQRFAESVGTMGFAGMSYVFGDEEGAFTQRGRLRGWTEFQNTVPFLSSYRDIARIVNNTEDPDDAITGLYRTLK